MFRDVLMTVDFDRTLTGPDSKIPARNLEAIEYFIANGGTFTVNTGRTPATFWRHMDVVPHNAPLLMFNGSAACWQGQLHDCKPIDLDVAVKEFRKPFISEKIMVEEYVNGYITAEERKKHFEKVDIHFVYDDVDKAAYKHFKKFYPAAKLMRAAFRMKNGAPE